MLKKGNQKTLVWIEICATGLYERERQNECCQLSAAGSGHSNGALQPSRDHALSVLGAYGLYQSDNRRLRRLVSRLFVQRGTPYATVYLLKTTQTTV